MFRQIMLALVAAVAALVFVGSLSATLIVDSPQQITRQVKVQLIQTAFDNGTSPATVFGNSSQRADIEAGLDTIWAQAGIDINVLPTITHYNNTFAYQGNAGSGTRPSEDLNTIFTNAASAGGILNADSLTLNLIMVNVVPFFPPLSELSSAGYARISGNGITGYVGDNLLTSDDNRDIVASVMAHEIGHNLGLSHTADGLMNLMSPQGTSQQLTTSQIATARSSNFARLFTPPGLTGDYNQNGVVDAADYVVWRNTLNQSGSGLPADGDNNGSIGAGDYTAWRNHFGATGGSGSLLLGDGVGAVPEPSAIAYLLLALTLHCSSRRKTNR